MAIQKITFDYSGRKRDVSIMRNTNPRIAEAQPVTLEFGRISAFCAGPQKLVQRYTIYFLSVLETQINYPSFGTDFLREVNQGLISTSQLTSIFTAANRLVTLAFRAHQSKAPVDPADERLNSATLVDVVVTGNNASLRIKIQTDAGDVVNFLMPLPES